jgi:D-alanyl-D-alanine carboxypeptidase
MKKIFMSVLSIILASISLKAQTVVTSRCIPGELINGHYSKADSLHSIMKRWTQAGLPGVAMAIYTEKEGWWAGAEGYSKMETKQPMENCNLQYLQSISKTYMAVTILQLHEERKIDLNAPITKYLPAAYLGYIRQAEKITVRMLLNHTSGLPEYSDDPDFVSYVVSHPLQKLSTHFILHTISGKELLFEPGTKHAYSNTNYELLALIADAVAGDHAGYMGKHIFAKLGLHNTFYRNDAHYLKYAELVNSYWDVLNTGKPADITEMQKINVSSYIGDDGIVCTPTDAIKFLKGLMEGKLLADSSLKAMETWVNDGSGNPVYGLGLTHFEAGGIEGYGHSGGGIGAGCILLYIPMAKTYVFFATNIGTLFCGSLPEKANLLRDELLMAVL